MTKINIVRQQEAELPCLVAVQFVNKGANYQQGVQISKRATALTTQQVTIQCPVVFTDAEAKNIAEILMYNAWIERDRFTLRLPRKYAYLEPTDVFSIYDSVNSFIYTVRIVQKVESRTGVIDLECVADHAPIYKQNAATSAVQAQVQTGTVASQTIVALMDLPALASQDLSTGYYLALGGTNSGWAGGSLYQSLDGGNTYTLVQSTASAATIGTTHNALGNWNTPGTVDTINTITVSVTSGSFQSVNATGIANGMNTIAVQTVGGYEILQFQTATLRTSVDGLDTYVLSGLRRGENGTSWATSGHAVGDQVVLLDSNLVRIPISSTLLDTEILYKAVSTGQTLSSVQPFTLANTGVAITPYAPTGVGATQSSGGDISLAWTRALRVGETSATTATFRVEIYDVEFATLKRTITGISSAGTAFSAPYSYSQQVADFGSVQTTLYAKVYQIDPVVGLGYPATLTQTFGSTGTVNSGSSFVSRVEAATASVSQTATVTTAGIASPQWNSADKDSSITLSNGDRTMTVLQPQSTSNSWVNTRSTTSHTTGKYYAEVILTSKGRDWGQIAFGIATAAHSLTDPAGLTADSFVYRGNPSYGQYYFNNNFDPADTSLPGSNEGDTLAMAVDFDAQLVWYKVNGGNWNNSATADPATGTEGKSFAGMPAVAHYLVGSMWHQSGFAGGTMTIPTTIGTPPSGFTQWSN